MNQATPGMSYRAIARSGYRAYAAKAGNKNYQGLPMPTWEDLPKNIQDCWEAATRQIEFCITGVHPNEPTDEHLNESRWEHWESPTK